MQQLIYLDHNATTPLDEEVREEMLRWMAEDKPSNPSSIHAFGREARSAIDKARASAARLIGARPDEIIFTGGGTEADNLAVLGVAAASFRKPRAIVTTAIEHQAVLNPCRHVGDKGGSVTYLSVDCEGVFDPDEGVAHLCEDTSLVSVMLANNDTGVIQPVAALAEHSRGLGIPFHTDAIQAVGKIRVDVEELNVDLLSFSGHKIYGPQGVGALYVRKGTRLLPRTFGGRQERSLRPGTENVGAIAGFGKACELAKTRLAADAAHMENLRSSFEAAVLERIPGVTVNGRGADRLPNTSNLSFDGLSGEVLAVNLDLLGVAVSTGSACSSVNNDPSHVLIAMGRTRGQAGSSVRFSFGRKTTSEDVARSVDIITRVVESIRKDRS